MFHRVNTISHSLVCGLSQQSQGSGGQSPSAVEWVHEADSLSGDIDFQLSGGPSEPGLDYGRPPAGDARMVVPAQVSIRCLRLRACACGSFGGDADAVARRKALLEGIPLIALTSLSEILAGRILEVAKLPVRARADALHIAVAESHGMDFLMTWNATHIANAQIRSKVEHACRSAGFDPRCSAVTLCLSKRTSSD